MSFFDSLIQTPVYQAQSMLDSYSKSPGQALVGANTPLETNLWNQVLGTKMTPTMNMYGGPSEATYAQAQREGVDLSAGRAADSVVPMVAGAVGSVFGGPAGGMAASSGAKAIGEMGRQGEIAQIRNSGMQGYQSQGLPAFRANTYANGGLASASKKVDLDRSLKVIAHYFKNRGIPVEIGMKSVMKEIASGLQLIPFESSVMGMKMLSPGVAQIHFFTTGTIKDLKDDMKYFVKNLRDSGVKTVYDTEPAPITSSALQLLGANVMKSDNPKYKFKAAI